ncbi:hypothetical protein [Spirosoma rhododendri]|uniref:Uncharacterized protein n=1 Tax=Spirosoma rhododendri TaxID=2728024 RepID=A0A7L5DMB7_9BACT|nr:hypothetical protein [Spirosoma rhododendri]QJD78672.1 hypothetical protein HH216_09720 [Spirosoma rhododendri]
MRTLSKYENFLVDEEAYFANRQFWNDTIDEVSPEPHEQWVTTQFANGVDFLDGNPIASALYKQWGKAIRIVQVANDNSAFPIRIWLDFVEYQETKILELVVLVQPRDEVYQRVIEVLTFFLFQSDSKKISKYVRAFNAFNRRAASLKQSVDAMRSISPVATNDLIKSTIETIYNQGLKRKKQST